MSEIICGFAGVGKSTLAKRVPGFVDLESTPFKGNWGAYIRVARHMAHNGYNVLLSCHEDLRLILRDEGVDYFLAIPSENKKSEYMRRYKERGSAPDFIKLMSDNWKDFLTTFPHERERVLIVEDYLQNALCGDVL